MVHVMPAEAAALPQWLGVGVLACGCHVASPALMCRALALSFRLPPRVKRRLPHAPPSSELVLALAALALRRSVIDLTLALRDIVLRSVRPTAEEVEVELDVKAG